MSGSTVYYYKNQTDGNQKGSFVVRGAILEKVEIQGKPFAFAVHNDSTHDHFYLVASSVSEIESWMSAMENAGARKGVYSKPKSATTTERQKPHTIDSSSLNSKPRAPPSKPNNSSSSNNNSSNNNSSSTTFHSATVSGARTLSPPPKRSQSPPVPEPRPKNHSAEALPTNWAPTKTNLAPYKPPESKPMSKPQEIKPARANSPPPPERAKSPEKERPSKQPIPTIPPPAEPEKITTANVISGPTLTSKPNPIIGKKPVRVDSIDLSKPNSNYSSNNDSLICPNCGLDWPSNVVFCGECGQSL